MNQMIRNLFLSINLVKNFTGPLVKKVVSLSDIFSMWRSFCNGVDTVIIPVLIDVIALIPA